LLIENQECGLAQLAAAAASGVEEGAGLNPVNEVALLGKTVVNLGLGIAVLELLPQMALLVGDFDQELCHALLLLWVSS
jgi:hypothetical protein